MPLTVDQVQTANRMASEAYTIEDIRKHLGLDYPGAWQEVRRHVDSWLGTKRQITIRLNNLASEPDPVRRQELKGELAERIDFLYYQAHDVAEKVYRVREALDG